MQKHSVIFVDDDVLCLKLVKSKSQRLKGNGQTEPGRTGPFNDQRHPARGNLPPSFEPGPYLRKRIKPP